MGMFLNSTVPYDAYKEVLRDRYFVDKSMLIEELIPALETKNRYFCITRPRRFGKTVMANMIGAFFEKTEEKCLFDTLAISKNPKYSECINSFHVFYIDFSRVPEQCKTYDAYITRFIDGLKKDVMEKYADLCLAKENAIWDILQEINAKTKDKFIFVIDEWDAIFHMPFVTKQEQQSFLLFLKTLLKDQTYVALAYMTGILPVAKYSSGSELNMFVEYDMVTSERFSDYFGFLENEIDMLYQIYCKNTRNPKISREELKLWYDGYYTAKGERLYNPRSVVLALSDNQLRNYWTSSGPYDEIFYYIQNNVQEIRDDLVLMVAGERVFADIGQYAAGFTEIDSREQIYSAMIVYGLLTYEDGYVLIPNKELMDKFNEMLMSKNSLGYVYQLAKKSEKMLQATLKKDTKTVEEILQFAHDTETPILSYNNEVELAAIVNLCYLSARNKYRVEREDKAGKGFVDFIFYPERPDLNCIILELKVNSTAEEALKQIKEKNYALKFRGKLGEKIKYTGKILLVGISYDKNSKRHTCIIETID